LRYIIILFNLLIINILTAEEPFDSLKVYNSKDSIVVVANRYEVSIKNIAYSYQVVPRKQIQDLALHSALEVVDIHFPSAFLFEKKVMGYGIGTAGSGSLYLRGQGGKPNTGVLVLLNGHPDFMGIFGHPLPDVYGMDDIEQAEILAGPTSTVFGSNAMGGVVNLLTSPDYSAPLKLSAEFGSFNTYNLGVNYNRRYGSSGMFLTLRRKSSDGHINNSFFESTHLQGGWQYQLNAAWNLSLSGRYVPYKFDDPSRGDLDTLNIGGFGDIRRTTGEIRLENKTDKWQGSLQLYSNAGNHKFYDGFQSDDYSYGFSVYQHWKRQANFSLAFGMDLIRYGGEARNNFAFLPNGSPVINNDPHSLTSSGTYVLGFYSPVSDLNFKLGMRYQYNSLPLESIAPVLGVSYSPLKSIKLYSNFQTGFRHPTLRDLYLFPNANQNLEEEEISSLEIGGVYHFGRQNSIQVAVYQNDIKNLIQEIYSGPPPPFSTLQNSLRGNQSGIETKLSYYPAGKIGLQLSHSYIDPGELTAFNPAHQFKYLLMTSWSHLNFALYGKYIDQLYAGNNHMQQLPDYHTVDLSISTEIKQFGLKLRLKNVLDRKYLVLPDYEAPGFHMLFGLNYKLKQ